MSAPNLLAFSHQRREFDRGMNQFCVFDKATVMLARYNPEVEEAMSNTGLYLPLDYGVCVSSEIDTSQSAGSRVTKPLMIDSLTLVPELTVVKGRRVGNRLLELAFPHEYSPALAAASLAAIKAFQVHDEEDARERFRMD